MLNFHQGDRGPKATRCTPEQHAVGLASISGPIVRGESVINNNSPCGSYASLRKPALGITVWRSVEESGHSVADPQDDHVGVTGWTSDDTTG